MWMLVRGADGRKDCQTKDWKEGGHKKECKAIKVLRHLLERDWSRFEDFIQFPAGN